MIWKRPLLFVSLWLYFMSGYGCIFWLSGWKLEAAYVSLCFQRHFYLSVKLNLSDTPLIAIWICVLIHVLFLGAHRSNLEKVMLCYWFTVGDFIDTDFATRYALVCCIFVSNWKVIEVCVDLCFRLHSLNGHICGVFASNVILDGEVVKKVFQWIDWSFYCVGLLWCFLVALVQG